MLLFYNTIHLCENYIDKPGVKLLDSHRKIISSNNSMFYDRSETVSIPVNVKNIFPIPSIPKTFNKSYDDICNETVESLISKNKKIKILWSGGIDSTLILVCFLRAGYKDQIEVLLSSESIAENYSFYRNHLLGKVKMSPAYDLKKVYDENSILLGGEYNDQLLGSNLLPLFLKYYDPADLFNKFDKDKLRKIFSSKQENNVDSWIQLYLETTSAAPVPIETNLDFHWWINFCCKWQGLYFRLVSYFECPVNFENYQHFFQNNDFQIWAMLNHSQHFDKWKDYKSLCKKIIWDFDKDDFYRDNKIKAESLTFLAQKNSFSNYIDEQGNYLQTITDREFILENSLSRQQL